MSAVFASGGIQLTSDMWLGKYMYEITYINKKLLLVVRMYVEIIHEL